MADAGYLSVRVIQWFFSKNLQFCVLRVIHHAGNRPENTVLFNRANVTTTMPSLYNFLISGRNSFRYHAVHALLLSMIWLLKIIDWGKKQGKNRLIRSNSRYMYLKKAIVLHTIFLVFLCCSAHTKTLKNISLWKMDSIRGKERWSW